MKDTPLATRALPRYYGNTYLKNYVTHNKCLTRMIYSNRTLFQIGAAAKLTPACWHLAIKDILYCNTSRCYVLRCYDIAEKLTVFCTDSLHPAFELSLLSTLNALPKAFAISGCNMSGQNTVFIVEALRDKYFPAVNGISKCMNRKINWPSLCVWRKNTSN